MEINKAALAAGDRSELLKLARSIKASAPRDKNAHPLVSEFFDSDPSGVRPLSTSELVASLAGAQGLEHDRWVEALAAGGYAAIALNRPDVAGDVSMIGGVRSGWTAPSKITPASGAKAAALEIALRKNRAAKGITTDADTGVLAALLAEIVKALIGCDLDSLDAATVKSRFSTALRKAGAKTMATVKEITDAIEEAKLKDAFTSTGGKWVRDGSHLRLSV